MVDVFLTVDTEAWPFASGWPALPLASPRHLGPEVSHYLYGTTPSGVFGVPYLLERLKAHALKATFFVEALSAGIVGLDELKQIVGAIEGDRQETQLQIHTEWLGEVAQEGLPQQYRQHLREFTLDEQCRIIAHGISTLERCGAPRSVAMRAGNFGANLDTLRAAAINGLRFDSSHNVAFLGTACDLATLGPLLHPQRVAGITEIPVSFFTDYPNHVRPAQVCACSADELQQALAWAWKNGWLSFVIVLHSFELLRRRGKRATPHPLHVARFDALCRFLDKNRDKFRTTHFRDYAAQAAPIVPDLRIMPSSWRRTIRRYGEQAIGSLI